jgi:DmsE family decaheme c-type cytochrome
MTSFLLKARQVDAKNQEAATPSGHAARIRPGYVGSDACTLCHQDLVNKFSTNPHTKMALMHSGEGVTCENCHGPGKAHIDSGGDVTKIFRFTKATPKEIDAKCLDCHAAAHPNFERSAHGEAKVSCTSCHSVHKFESEAGLLKVPQPKLCYTCHSDVKPAFSMPFHHRIDEGLMNCSDCHDPHGTFQRKQLKVTADQNAVCTKCHTETAGPFAYEHPVVKAEGCTFCHSPHGSPNARLLNVSNVNTMCLQCHSAVLGFGGPAGPVHNQAVQYQACTVCHTQIHGSNASDIFFK